MEEDEEGVKGEEAKEEEEEGLNLIAREWTTERNSITDTFHCFRLFLFPALPRPLFDHTMNSEPSILYSLSFVSLLPYDFSYLHSISGRVQRASLREVQRREEEERSAEQHRAQHGSDDRQQGQVEVRNKAPAARKCTRK